MVFVVQTDTDQLEGLQDRSVHDRFRHVEQVALNTARSALDRAKLGLKNVEAVLNLEDLFQRKDNAREFQEILADGLGDIETLIAKHAAEAHQVRHGPSGKVHEFH